ncbi:MAG: transglycosylase SLT domain-containing protein [Dehalococcoidia bacterium]|nr:transglycosylase SLT domain-containing protein [Dehalococcoidia bacterium]
MRAIAVLLVAGVLTACGHVPPAPPPTPPQAVAVDVDKLAGRLDMLSADVGRVAESLNDTVRLGREQKTLLLARLRPVEDLAPPEYRQLVVEVAERHGLSPRLLAALVVVESAWNPNVVGTAGEIGLTQVMPATATWIAGMRGREPPNLRDPLMALDTGAWYLAALIRETGDEAEALARYNGGPRWRERAPITARGYSQRVLARVASGRGS